MDIQKNTKQKNFEQYLATSVSQKRYVKLQYFTDIHEFITLMTIIDDMFDKDNISFLSLNTGEEICIDKIVRIDGVYAPKYAHIADFSCDC